MQISAKGSSVLGTESYGVVYFVGKRCVTVCVVEVFRYSKVLRNQSVWFLVLNDNVFDGKL